MKKILFMVMAVMVSTATFARKGAVVYSVSNDTIFYNHEMKAVANGAEATYYRILAKEDFKGTQRDIFEDYYLNGQKRCEGGYAFIDLANDANTVLDGTVITYYPNGKEKWRCNYKDGKRNGYLTLQMRDGSIAVVEYVDGESKYDYATITSPDGNIQKRSLGSLKQLL